jgi:hypothetical protein
LEILRACITFYKQNSKHGERFAELLKERDFDNLVKIYGKL